MNCFFCDKPAVASFTEVMTVQKLYHPVFTYSKIVGDETHTIEEIACSGDVQIGLCRQHYQERVADHDKEEPNDI